MPPPENKFQRVIAMADNIRSQETMLDTLKKAMLFWKMGGETCQFKSLVEQKQR